MAPRQEILIFAEAQTEFLSSVLPASHLTGTLDAFTLSSAGAPIGEGTQDMFSYSPIHLFTLPPPTHAKNKKRLNKSNLKYKYISQSTIKFLINSISIEEQLMEFG